MSKLIGLCLKLFVSAFLVWLLTHYSKLDLSLLPQLFNSPNKIMLVMALYLIGITISCWRWKKLNEVQGIHLSYAKTLLPTYLGIALNNLLPGGVSGDFYRFYYINKAQFTKKSAVMLSILFDRIIGLCGILIIATLSIGLQLYEYYHTLPAKLLITASCLLLGGGFLYFVAYHYLITNNQLRKWLEDHSALKLTRVILPLFQALNIYRRSKQSILKCLLASLLIQLIITFTCIFIANLMGYPKVSIISYIIACSVTQIVNLIPLAPGGLGVGEIAFANILTLLNPSVTAPFATIFLAYRILGILIYLPAILLLPHKLINTSFSLEESHNQLDMLNS